MDESAQTPSDRFVKWLKDFTGVLQESEEFGGPGSQVLVEEDDTYELTQARKALRQEVLAFGHAFTHMLLRDQASAVTRFEVGVSVRYSEDKKVTSEPYKLVTTEVEIIEAEFSQPFLAEVFRLLWIRIVEAEVDATALRVVKSVTAYYAPNPWSQMRWPTSKIFPLLPNRNWTSWKQLDSRCSICGEVARTPYSSCYYCNDRPSFHHGHCCPNRWWGKNRSQGKGSPAASSDSAAPAPGGL